MQRSQHGEALAESYVIDRKASKGNACNSAHAISATCNYLNAVVAADTMKSFIQTNKCNPSTSINASSAKTPHECFSSRHRHLPASLPPPSSSSSSTSAGVLRSCRLLRLLCLFELILLALSSGISSLAASSKPSSVSLSQRSPSWLAGVLRRASGSMEPRRF